MDNGLLNAGMEESKDLVALADGSTGLRKDDQVVYRDEILTGYTDFKGKLDTELKANAEGFVRIGYLLKVARDTNILAESGYKNVAEFAFAEYQLTKDIVSRYIAINDKYAENGYSDKLQTKFEGFGVAKLQEMLTLPDAIIEEIEPTLTKREIIDIKREVAAEEQITPIEVMIEAAAPEVQKEEKELTLTQRVWKDIIKGLWDKYSVKDKNSALYRIITAKYPFVTDDNFFKPLETALYELIAPSGTATLWARLQGVGRYMVTVKGLDEPISMVNARDGSKVNTSFADAVRDIAEIFEGECTAESWEKVYGLVNPQYEEKKDGETRGDGDHRQCSGDSNDRNTESGKKGSKEARKADLSMPVEASGKQGNGRDAGTGEAVQEAEKDTGADDIRVGVISEKEAENGEKVIYEASSQPNKVDVQSNDGYGGTAGEVAPVQPKQLGKLDIGDRVVNVKPGIMLGYCAGEYKIGIDNGGVTLASKDSIRWAKAEEKKEAEEEPRNVPAQPGAKFDPYEWHNRLVKDADAINDIFEGKYSPDAWTKEAINELVEKAFELINDAKEPLEIRTEDGGFA